MKKNYFLIALVIFVFAVISFSTNMIAPLESEIASSFNLNGTLAGLLPFAFFIAYLISIPAAALLESWREKKTIIAAFCITTVGALIFAFSPSYITAIGSLFMVGAGMAVLQVVINPLLRSAAGEKDFAFYSVVAQIVFGMSAAVVAPFSSYATHTLADFQIPKYTGMHWVANYWVIAAISVLVIAFMAIIKLPSITLQEDEKHAEKEVYFNLLKSKKVWAFFFAIFAYVGTEQGIGVKIKSFLVSYHNFSAQEGDTAIFWYWTYLTIGCLLGLLLVKIIKGKTLLKIFASAGILFSLLAIWGSAEVSFYTFQIIGFCLSIMWSVIFSLAMNSFDKHHGALAGIFCTGIIGGAVSPFVIGVLQDLLGSLRYAMCFNIITLAYIFSVGIWAKPLVENKLISLKKATVN